MIKDLLQNGCAENEAFENLVKLLSNREIEVMILFAFGLSRKESAEKLDISPRTIDTYVERIKQKLGLCGNREVFQQAINCKDCLINLYNSSK